MRDQGTKEVVTRVVVVWLKWSRQSPSMRRSFGFKARKKGVSVIGLRDQGTRACGCEPVIEGRSRLRR
jgi:hypothetical protein